MSALRDQLSGKFLSRQKKSVSGVVIAKDLLKHGFPLDLSLRCWSRVCDEIVVVTDHCEPSDINIIYEICNDKNIECEIKIRAVGSPNNFEFYRFVGYFFCKNPDYVVHFDADYLISQTEAKKLRKTIENAPPENDIITYELVYLNYYGDMLFEDCAMTMYVKPYNGYSGIYPFVLNVKRQNFILPVGTFSERHNVPVNMESIINLGENWGGTYDQKFNKWSMFSQSGGNPDGFNIIDSDVKIEHLSWSLNEEALLKKLSHPHWSQNTDRTYVIDENYVKGGNQPWRKNYKELAEMKKRMKQ